MATASVGQVMSKVYTIPERAKPGRKPSANTSKNKRADQNRKAQAKHREAKRDRAQQLQDEVNRQNASLRERDMRIQQLEAELHRVRAAAAADHQRFLMQAQQMQAPQMQAQQILAQQGPLQNSSSVSSPTATFQVAATSMSPGSSRSVLHPQPEPAQSFVNTAAFSDASSSHACDRCTPEHCACVEDVFTHPVMRDAGTDDEKASAQEQDHSAHELDFTTHGIVTDSCGFCDEPGSHCPCKDKSPTTTQEKVSPVATGPGSCSDCQVDPKKRKWCQTFSRLRNEITPPYSLRSSAASLRPIEPKFESSIDRLTPNFSAVPGTQSIGCSETYKLLDGRVPLDNDAMEWRQLKPVPPQLKAQDDRRDTFMSMEPGRYSAMEVDVGSILATLSSSRRPLEPRPSDGSRIALVEQAEMLRRDSVLPLSHDMDGVSENNKGT